MIYLLLSIIILLFVAVLMQNIMIKRQLRQANKHLEIIILELSCTKVKKITNNKEINELLKIINRLVEKNQQIQIESKESNKRYQRMIADIAHDFKTPATSILGYLELSITSTDAIKKNEYLLIIRKRLESLNLLIDNFFFLSLIESDLYPYKVEVINPKKILQEQLSLYYGILEEIFAEINIELDEQSIYTKLDKRAFLRIIMNIIGNSINHGSNVLEIRERQTEKYYYLLIKNDITTISADTSSGIGLQVINNFAKDLGIKVNIEKNHKEFIIELVLKLVSTEGSGKNEKTN